MERNDPVKPHGRPVVISIEELRASVRPHPSLFEDLIWTIIGLDVCGLIFLVVGR